LHEGSVLLVKGPSGSGKSTLLRILSRLQALVEGQIYFQGINMLSFTPQLWRSKVLYVPQKPAIFAGTVYDNLLIPYTLRINKSKDFKLEIIKELFGKLLLDFSITGQNAKTLSGGEAARIALLRAVLMEPNILLLDEPTAALDDSTKKAVLSFLAGWLEQKKDRGIVLVSHSDESATFSTASVLKIGGG